VHHAAHALAVDRWSTGASPLHARDARAKFIALLVFLIAVSTTRPGAGIAFALYAAIVIMAAFIARLPFLALLKRAAMILPFSATFALITWWSGEPERAAAFAEKSVLSAFAALLLIATTPINDLLRALASLGMPRQLIFVVQFLHRYLFVIAEQAQHMRLAAQCRRGLAKHRRFRFQGAAGALGVLFARSWERADGIYRAMLARGFTGQFPRLTPAQFRFADAVFLLVAAVTSVSIRLAL
jgi:cobalt/nickel transport system permease protein